MNVKKSSLLFLLFHKGKKTTGKKIKTDLFEEIFNSMISSQSVNRKTGRTQFKVHSSSKKYSKETLFSKSEQILLEKNDNPHFSIELFTKPQKKLSTGLNTNYAVLRQKDILAGREKKLKDETPTKLKNPDFLSISKKKFNPSFYVNSFIQIPQKTYLKNSNIKSSLVKVSTHTQKKLPVNEREIYEPHDLFSEKKKHTIKPSLLSAENYEKHLVASLSVPEINLRVLSENNLQSTDVIKNSHLVENKQNHSRIFSNLSIWQNKNSKQKINQSIYLDLQGLKNINLKNKKAQSREPKKPLQDIPVTKTDRNKTADLIQSISLNNPLNKKQAFSFSLIENKKEAKNSSFISKELNTHTAGKNAFTVVSAQTRSEETSIRNKLKDQEFNLQKEITLSEKRDKNISRKKQSETHFHINKQENEKTLPKTEEKQQNPTVFDTKNSSIETRPKNQDQVKTLLEKTEVNHSSVVLENTSEFDQHASQEFPHSSSAHTKNNYDEKNLQENRFSRNLILNLKLGEVNLRALYNGAKLDLSIFLSSINHSSVNLMKNEISHIIEESGIKEYFLRIKSREKEVRYSSESVKIKENKSVREINVRV